MRGERGSSERDIRAHTVSCTGFVALAWLNSTCSAPDHQHDLFRAAEENSLVKTPPGAG